MTALEMQKAFQLKTSKYSILEGIEFRTDEIEMLLNEAQDKLVDLYYSRFEFDESIKKYLSRIITSATLGRNTYYQGSSMYPLGEVWKIYSGIKYVVAESATYVFNGVTYSPTVKPIRLNYYNKNKNNPFKKPSTDVIWRLDFRSFTTPLVDDLVTLIKHNANSVLSNYTITYLRQPRKIDLLSSQQINCELHEQVHSNIVDMAVQFAVQNAQLRMELRKETLPKEGEIK